MSMYRVCMKVEQDGPAEQDLEVVKIVQASSDLEAVEEARSLVETESPDINAAKIWAWSSEMVRSSQVAGTLCQL